MWDPHDEKYLYGNKLHRIIDKKTIKRKSGFNDELHDETIYLVKYKDDERYFISGAGGAEYADFSMSFWTLKQVKEIFNNIKGE